MKDLYFLPCSEYGNYVTIALDEEPTEDTKIICKNCKEKDNGNFLSW
jgi:hypothetical protein